MKMLNASKVNALRELQSASWKELSALMLSHMGMISVLDRASKNTFQIAKEKQP
jgi:hypothetical protein